MAMVTLTRTWLSLAGDPSQSIVFDRETGGRQPQPLGEVRKYANGRLRYVGTAAAVESVPLSFRTTSMATADLLQSWTGQTLCLRDTRGRKLFVQLLAVTETDLPASYVKLDLALSTVTYSEAV